MAVSWGEFGRCSGLIMVEAWEMEWCYHGGSLEDKVTLSYLTFGRWSDVIIMGVWEIK